MEVVVDSIVSDKNGLNLYACRSQYNAPDIDGTIFVYTKDKLLDGEFVEVEIKKFDNYDLIGEKV